MGKTRIVIRVDRDMHDALVELARADRRSLNTYVALALEDLVRRNAAEAPRLDVAGR